MKISKSKQELARIISENGGWPCDAEHSSQDGSDGQVSFFKSGAPTYNKLSKIWNAHSSCVHMYWSRIKGLGRVGVIKNFHQTILSRSEYFHLYPAPDADGWIAWSGGECPVDVFVVIEVRYRDYFNEVNHIGESRVYDWAHHGCQTDIIAYRLHKPEQAKPAVVGDDETNLAAKEELEAMEYKPSIEQLAGDYRNKLAIATQAQEEADSHRCGAEVALSKLEVAAKELGFKIEPITAKQEMSITDWRNLQVGDEVEARCHAGVLIGLITEMEPKDYDGERPFRFQPFGEDTRWCTSSNFRFIRRP